MFFLAVAAIAPRGDAQTVSLEIPDAPRQGYAVKGWGFAVDLWIWIDVNDLTDGSQPVHGPDAFQPDANGNFESPGPSALPCGHAFQATAFVDGWAVATSPAVTPDCAPAGPSLVLAVPDAPGTGFTAQGLGFDAGSWVWLTVEDTTTGAKPVDGPDAFQPGGGGAFTRVGDTTLTCGHTFTAKAWVDNRVAATSANVSPRCGVAGAPTADPNATADAKAVYDFLKSASSRPDRRVAIGQALRGWDFDQPVDQPVTALTSAGLPAPKLLEVDVTVFGITPEHDQELYGLLINHAAQGGLVGITYHADNPFTGGSAWDVDGVDLAELSNPANPWTWAGQRWQAELDKVAGVLSNLQAAGAVVLFRPLHESNGSWFWWGQTDPASFQTTWRGVFNYLTVTKGLHNLLWVYSANRNLGGDLYNPTRLYPGDDLVDVVGLDIYDDDLSDAVAGEPGYAAMVGLGKPFAITEYGAASGHDGAMELANPEVIARVKEQYPATVLATAWYSQDGDNWQISDKPDAGALLLDPWAVVR